MEYTRDRHTDAFVSARVMPSGHPGAQNHDAGPSARDSVELYIEELVFHGYADAEHQRIGEALARKLTELLTEQGMPQLLTSAHGTAFVDGGNIELPPNATAEVIGARIAQALYGGLWK